MPVGYSEREPRKTNKGGEHLFSDMKHLRNVARSFGPAGAAASTGAVSAKIPPGF